MEKRGEDQRDIGIPNFMGYNQESPVKLPLAPIVSTPPDRRGNATVSTRRGSAIFSPTQTLDHHRTLPLPLPPLLVQKDSSIPAPDPDQVTSPGGVTGGASNSKSPPPPPQQTDDQESGSIRYRECLKNHAAKMGGHVVDGCGEFMPSGDQEGTPEFLRCAACDCHRNFHRKQVQGGHTNNSHRIPVVRSQSPPPMMPSQHHNYPPPPVMVAFGGNSGGAAADSSSEDLNIYDSSGGGHAMSLSGSKKRFRTKFSQEQKDKMHELAGKLGWRIQKQDEQQVQHLCNEVGVKREVFKVWLHNNKQAMKKRQI